METTKVDRNRWLDLIKWLSSFMVVFIYVYAIWRLVVRFGDKFVLLLSCFCLFFHFILGNLLPILRVDLSIFSINNKLVLIRNWLLMGLPFFGFGYLTNKNKEKLFNIKWWGLICLIVFGFLETLIGYYFFGRFELYIGSTAIAFALIMVALKLEGKPINKLLVTLSSTSTDIYIYHIIISNAGRFILKFLKMDWSWLLLIWPVLVCCASVAFSLIKNTLFLLIKKKKASP